MVMGAAVMNNNISLYICSVLLISALTGLCFLFNKAKRIKTDKSGVEGFFYKISTFIFYKFMAKNRKICPENIRSALSRLESSGGCKEETYYINKVKGLIEVLLGGLILAVIISVSSYVENINGEVSALSRDKSAKKSKTLIAAEKDGNELGSYELEITPRLYTDDEIKALFEEASYKIFDLIIGDNKSLSQVENNLRLVKKIEGYPFSISWRSGDYKLVNSYGEVDTSSIEDFEDGREVTLCAEYKYNGKIFEQEIYVNVFRKSLYGEELLHYEIENALNEANKSSEYSEEIILPDIIAGKEIKWKSFTGDNSLLILIPVIAAGAAVYFLPDSSLKEKLKKRNEELRYDYPFFVSKIVLYLGAGLTIRGIFEKLAEDYRASSCKDDKKRYLYEEICRMVRAMDGGQSEEEAYLLFSASCGLQEYSRLVSILTQNLRKGQSKLKELLMNEAREAGIKRLDNARIRAEQASIKLMLPMMIMLGTVMALIMIPAFRSF